MVYRRDKSFSCDASEKQIYRNDKIYLPRTEEKPDGAGGGAAREAVGKDGGAGLGAVLHGSRPSESYTELARGLSTTKLPPRLVAGDVP